MEIWPPDDHEWEPETDDEIAARYEREADEIAEHVRTCDLHQRDIYCKICHEM